MDIDDGKLADNDLHYTPPTSGFGPAPLLLAVGLGDPDRERELLPHLSESGQFAVAERCLSAEQLLACVLHNQVDAALVAWNLHRLNGEVTSRLTQLRVPMVLLAMPADAQLWRGFSGVIVPPDAGAEVVQHALLAAVRGERLTPAPAVPAAEPPREPPSGRAEIDDATGLSLIAVASGYGSPGRTTIALNLAAALGAVVPTVLVDADVSGPSIAAYLDADPTRNLSMLAHAEPATPREWDRAIAQETQRLGPRSPHGVVLCGVPKPEMRTGISPRFFAQLLGELRQRYRYVILDVGADLLGAEAAVHRTALESSQQVLLVASADLIGLWHARTALAQLQTHLARRPDQIALILNRYDRSYHHGRTEIEWALGVPTAAVIPFDQGAAQRAITAQRPLVLDSQSRAARALLDLAGRVHGGGIVLPPEPARQGQPAWRRWAAAVRLPRRGKATAPKAEKGAPDGHYAASRD